MRNYIIYFIQGSQPPWKNVENKFQFFRSEKSQGIWENASNQGKVRDMYYVNLPKRERDISMTQNK